MSSAPELSTARAIDPEPEGRARSRRAPRLWSNRDYLAWLVADTTALAGTVVVAFLLPLIALMYLDDPAAAGIIGAAGTLARVVVMLPAGVLADRYDRKRLMILGAGLGLVPLIGLLAMHVTGSTAFWMLLGIAILFGLRTGMFQSVPNTALKSVVGTESLPTALSANQGRDGAIQLGAAPAGGALLAVGVIPALVAPAVAFVLATLAPLGIRRDLRPARAEDSAQGDGVRGAMGEAFDGLRWVWSRATLRGIIFVAPVINLAVNTALLTLVFSFQQEGVSPATIGLLTSALGAATIVGALAAPVLVRRIPGGVLIFTGIAIAATGVCVLPFLDGVAAMIAVFGACFTGIPALNAALIGYFMAVTPDHLMGRSLVAFEVLAMGSVPLAPVIAGFGLSSVGVEGTLFVAAGLALVAATAVLLVRGLRTLPLPDGWETHGV